MTDQISLGVARRDYKDRKPGTPVPLHEPDPDRFAKSDALRARIEAEKMRRSTESIAVKKREAERRGVKRAPMAPRETLAERTAKHVIELPDTITSLVAPDCAELVAHRNGRSVFFASAAAAAEVFVPTALTGDERLRIVARYTVILRSYLREGDGVADVFGWRWTRLMRRPKKGRGGERS